jgi:hypothetical protein
VSRRRNAAVPAITNYGQQTGIGEAVAGLALRGVFPSYADHIAQYFSNT